MRASIALLLCVLLAGCGGGGTADGGGAADAENWVGTWHSGIRDNLAGTNDITYRLLIHNALGGGKVRLRFSNRYGKEALKIRNVSIALPLAGLKVPAVNAATVTPLTFGGSREAIIPAGQEIRSDAAVFALPGDSDIAVTFYVPETVTNVSAKGLSLTLSWSNGAGGGDASDDTSGLSLINPEGGWAFLTGLEVVAPGATTVVALGDSITDGAFEIPEGDTRWPDLLNDRIKTSDLAGKRSVVNSGISGNMITADRDGKADQGQAAVTRMAWDAFEEPNLSHIILFEGINDIGEAVPAEEIIAGARRIIAEAHRRGVKVIVATLTPCFGNPTDFAYTANAAQRIPFNDWVLNSGEPDGVIDFNGAVSTGLTPETWIPALTIDFLHPNPLGLVVMTNAIPLDLLR